MPLPGTLDRYTILKDITFNSNQVTAGDIPGQFWFDMKCNFLMDYLDGAATITSAGSGALYVIVVNDTTVGIQDYNYLANLYFTDV